MRLWPDRRTEGRKNATIDLNLRDTISDLRGLKRSHVAAWKGSWKAAAWPPQGLSTGAQSLQMAAAMRAWRPARLRRSLGCVSPAFAPCPLGHGPIKVLP